MKYTLRYALIVAVLLVASVAGCSRKSKATSAPSTIVGSSTTAPATGSGDLSGRLASIATMIESGEVATFKAVYTYTVSGSDSTVTVEQKPPKSVFVAGGDSVIVTGTATYFCAASQGKATCIDAGAANPLATLTQLFSPATALKAIQHAQTDAAGGQVSVSAQSYAGQNASCVTDTVPSSTPSGTYCVTDGGILAYGGTATANIALTDLSTTVADGDFAPPAGATMQTIPKGVTAP
jgi:hypothetical protein